MTEGAVRTRQIGNHIELSVSEDINRNIRCNKEQVECVERDVLVLVIWSRK